jgi:hypothetical protein
MNNKPTLSQTQEWVNTVLIVRGDLAQKIQTAADINGLQLDHLIKTTRGLSAQRRLDIYASGYVLRLVDCLKSEFSLLAAFMGEQVFEIFAKAFIVTIPSKYWSLHYRELPRG